jgi:hypothetical protein
VNGLLFAMAGMLAAQRRRAASYAERNARPSMRAVSGSAA